MKESTENNIQEPLIRSEPEPPKSPPPASFFALFKFSTDLDKVLMIFGSIAAMGSGVMFPLFLIFFGDITLIFIESNRQHAAEQGLKIAIKFFILGGSAWLSSNIVDNIDFLAIYFWNYTGARQILQYKKTYYETLLNQQVAYFDSIDTNQLATQISGNIVAIQTALSQKMAIILSVTVTSLFGFIYAFFNCWQLSLVLTGVLPLLMISGMLMMKSMMLAANKNKQAYQQAGGIAQQALSAIKTIKSLVGQTFQLTKFTQALDKCYGKSMRYTLYSAASIGLIIFIFLGVYSLGFWYGKTLIIEDHQKYDSAKIIATFFCFIIGGSSIGQISPVLQNIAGARVAAAKLFELMKRQKTLIQPQKGVELDKIKDIQFKDVQFKYPKLKQEDQGAQLNQVLKNISIKFPKNKITALVGESGSGKSTIVQLLMRYYDPTNGTILINDNALDHINISSFRKKVGFVGQEPVLFSMSIEENIKIANPNITQQQIRQCLKKSNSYDFVMEMEEGLHTYVGTGGAQLSGGQKQRIAIARAVCRNPQILILDQATSALDRKNEKQIQQTLKKLSEGNITCIVIAHRLSTIKNADNIIVMDHGSIVQQGNHQQLFSKNGTYYSLVKTQMSAETQQNLNEQMVQKVQDNKPNQKQQLKSPQKKKQAQHPKQKLDAVFRKLFKYSIENLWLYIVGSITAIIRGAIFPLFNIALSNVLALLPEAYIPEKDAQINKYCIFFACVAVVGGLTTFSYMFCFGIISDRLVYKIRNNLFAKLLKLPVSYYDKSQNTPGAISTKIAQDAFQINNMTSGVIAVIFLNFATVTTSMIFAFYYSWMLTLIVLGISPLLIISGSIQMAMIKKLASKAQTSQKILGTMISDTVCNIRTVKSFGHNQQFLNKFSNNLTDIFDTKSKKILTSAILQGLSRGMIMFVEGLMFYIAAVLYTNNLITNSQSVYIAIFSIIFAAVGIGQNSAFMPDMVKAKIAGANVFDVLEAEDEQQKSVKEGGAYVGDIQGNIEFKNVTFKYPQRQQVILQNFNLKIAKGEKIGLVGPSGSGKSTIIQILMRFYDVETGEIFIDNRKITEYQLYNYRKQIGLVSQQPVLFQGTVKQNIQFNLPQNQKRIQKYTDIAYASNFIKQWEQGKLIIIYLGYQKEVGQKGSQVSGGQKQRIALARCLIRKPKLLLLDQSTSALDADSEKAVFKNLKPIFKKVTSISIAHRLSTIEDTSRIIMMRNGIIIQEGPFDQLMKLKGNFYNLAKGLK